MASIITRLQLVLDPECSGLIYRSQLQQILLITGQQTEVTNSQTIEQTTLLKLKDFLILKRISPEQLFNAAAASNSKSI